MMLRVKEKEKEKERLESGRKGWMTERLGGIGLGFGLEVFVVWRRKRRRRRMGRDCLVLFCLAWVGRYLFCGL